MRFSLGTVHKRLVLIPNIIEEMNLVLSGKERGADRVHGSITPAFVVESTLGVEVLEVFGVGFATPEVEVANFEVGPDCGTVG